MRVGRLSAEQVAALSMAERYEVVQHGLSRRGLLRTAGVALLGPGPALLTSRASPASSQAVPIIGRWIALGRDPASQVTVRAQVAAPVSGARVQLGHDTGYGQSVPAELQTLRTTLGTGEVVEQHYLLARFDHLHAGTGYHYRVVHDGGASDDAGFRTAHRAGQRAAFTFTAFGDQSVSAGALSVEALIARIRPAFHLLAGDISYADSGGEGRAVDTYRPRRWDQYFAQIDRVAASTPWMVTVGNHEMEAVYGSHGYGGFVERFSMPADGPAACPATWSMVYGTLAVISLDANDVTTELVANQGYSGGEQTRWAADRLRGLRADPRIDFIVVMMHQCAYATSTAHGSDLGVRKAWTDLFDTHQVDLVISGHNHTYERTDPIRADRATRAAPTGTALRPDVDGTTYVVAGGGGAPPNGFRSEPRILEAESRPEGPVEGQYVERPGHYVRDQVTWSRARYPGFSLLALDVDPSSPGGTARLTLRALDDRGRMIDTLTLERAVPSFLKAHEQELAIGAAASAALGAGALLARRQRAGRT